MRKSRQGRRFGGFSYDRRRNREGIMRFTKMQGAGNDFVLIENLDGSIDPADYPRLAARLCHRRLSIGADGLMILEPPRAGGDVRMAFFNSDGSVGEMCGNGAR